MKRCLSVVFALALALPLLAQEEGTGSAAGAQVDTTGKGYTAVIVMEPHSKRVLFEENAHVKLPTASMAKMMTLLLTLEAIGDGQLQWDSPVNISARASKMGGSQVYLKAGSVWPVKNLVIATMIQSANDAAAALAEKIGGSNEAFADLMNKRAQELGLKETEFWDPHGLPNKDNPSHIDQMSAYDLAVLGTELMKHPFMGQLAVIPEMPFQNGTLAKIYNPNHLINPKSPDYYDAATGIKTGYSGPAGYCVTASAKRGDMELVAVVMGAKPSRGPLSSFGIAQRLFNETFANYRVLKPVKKGDVVGQANVSNGRAKTVPVVASQDAVTMVKRGEDKNVKVNYAPTALTAPVPSGQAAGNVVVTVNGQQVASVPAVTQAGVEKQPGWKAFWPF